MSYSVHSYPKSAVVSFTQPIIWFDVDISSPINKNSYYVNSGPSNCPEQGSHLGILPPWSFLGFKMRGVQSTKDSPSHCESNSKQEHGRIQLKGGIMNGHNGNSAGTVSCYNGDCFCVYLHNYPTCVGSHAANCYYYLDTTGGDSCHCQFSTVDSVIPRP